MKKKIVERPFWITLLSIISFLYFLYLFIVVFILQINSGYNNSLPIKIFGYEDVTGWSHYYLMFWLFIDIILALIFGYGLWKGKNWIRILFILSHIVGILFTFFVDLPSGVEDKIASGIWQIIVSAIIVCYFIFNKKVRLFFGIKEHKTL